MITKNDVERFIKPGSKIQARVTYQGREQIAVYTIKEVIYYNDKIFKFKDKNDRERTLRLEQIINIKEVEIKW